MKFGKTSKQHTVKSSLSFYNWFLTEYHNEMHYFITHTHKTTLWTFMKKKKDSISKPHSPLHLLFLKYYSHRCTQLNTILPRTHKLLRSNGSCYLFNNMNGTWMMTKTTCMPTIVMARRPLTITSLRREMSQTFWNTATSRWMLSKTIAVWCSMCMNFTSEIVQLSRRMNEHFNSNFTLTVAVGDS